MPQIQFEQGSPAPLPLPRREEEEVMQTWDSRGTPLVSICCATFNHVEYIEDALNGFLGQVTSFPFEIIVRDDASTDGTSNILKEYAARYPNIIRPVIETENQHSKGIRANPALAPLAKGEFLALCEGDDYWFTPDKLEKQVSLLKAHPQATMCVARTVVCTSTNDGMTCTKLFMGNEKDLQYFDDIERTYFHTSTYFIPSNIYRRVLADYAKKIEYGDTALRYMLVVIGPFVLLKEVVSVYRVTGRGIWTSLDIPKRLAWEIKMTEGFLAHFDRRYRHFFGVKLLSLYIKIFRHGVLAFNSKSAVVNFSRFLYLSSLYGISLVSKRLIKCLYRQ